MATIRKRGDKYEVQIRRSGLQHVSKSFHALKDAKAWARHMEVQADRHELPSDPKALQQVTLGELVARYRDTISSQKRSSDREWFMLSTLLAHPVSRKRLSEVTGSDFAAYRDQRLQDIKPASVKRELAPVRHLFEVARDEWGLPIKENPLARLQFKGADRRRERRLRPRELDRLIEAAKVRRNSLVVPIIRLAVETGMRRGEILSIRRSDIDAVNRTLLIRETKNGHPRTIPLTKGALAVLQHCPGEDRVFPMTPNAFRLAWQRVKARAGIEDLHFHDLRHEAISRFFEMGLNATEVALISGHRDMRMLARYTHPQRQLISQKLDRATLEGDRLPNRLMHPTTPPSQRFWRC